MASFAIEYMKLDGKTERPDYLEYHWSWRGPVKCTFTDTNLTLWSLLSHLLLIMAYDGNIEKVKIVLRLFANVITVVREVLLTTIRVVLLWIIFVSCNRKLVHFSLLINFIGTNGWPFWFYCLHTFCIFSFTLDSVSMD